MCPQPQTATHCIPISLISTPSTVSTLSDSTIPSPSPIGLTHQLSTKPIQQVLKPFPQFSTSEFPLPAPSPTNAGGPPPTLATTTFATHLQEFSPKDFTHNGGHGGNWSFRLPIPIPNAADLSQLVRPTLTGLSYTIKYASTFDKSDSTIQTDVVLTSKALEAGLVTSSGASGEKGGNLSDVFYQSLGYAPRVIDQSGGSTISLSTTHSIKSNHSHSSTSASWNHFIEHRDLTSLSTKITSSAYLYLILSISEYTTLHTSRALAIQVSASWTDDSVERARLEDEAKKVKAAEEAKKKQEEEDAKKKKKEEEDKLKEEIRKGILEELKKKADEEAAAAAKKKAEEEAAAKKKAEEEAAAAAAKKKADEEAAAAAAKKKADEEAAAAAAAAAKKKADEDAAAAAAAKKAQEDAAAAAAAAAKTAPAEADSAMQEKIKEKLDKLPANRRCPQGYAWKKSDKGYVCGGGGHHITWEELAAL